jgi:hypothetical protein
MEIPAMKYLTVAEYATEKRVSVRVIRAEIGKACCMAIFILGSGVW